MTCEEIVIRLKNIQEYLTQLLATTNAYHQTMLNPITYRGQTNGWNINRTGSTWFYEQLVTFTGAAQSINLDFRTAIKLRLIEQIFNDTTSKDFSIKKATSENITAFTQLSTQIGHVALSELDYDLGSIAQLGRLQFTYSNTTLGKTVIIRVTAEEIYNQVNS